MAYFLDLPTVEEESGKLTIIEKVLPFDIKTEIHYPLAPYQQKAMKNILSESFPISEEMHQSTQSLPISFFHMHSDFLRIINVLNRWVNGQ